ncbi:triglyceride lipase [Malassezia pachydermatis]|uniref:triacylglycerol lipase n=2 Tax=Malassezia pachydermatis TaxID=77020 RepID=A0A0M8MLF2_9BASI|nr:putative secretory lipase (family lip) [Malassezia pachydermatis]KOS13928.1 putative secretory lipase (family lip) [Malassezia pachydermatis]
MKFLLALFCAVLLALPVWTLEARESLPFPPNDPFYTPPDGWQDKPNGHIFRSRKVELQTLFHTNVEEAWQVLYRTTYASDDQPTTSVTTIMVPYNAKRNGVVVYGDFEDSNAPQCAPSYAFRAGPLNAPSSKVNMVITFPFLQEGYIVTVPDKEGRKGLFASGIVEGRQTLDGIRATLAFDKLKLDKNVKVVGSGYSGGAIQTGWAASLKPTYAPELPVVGWYAGGTPSNLTDLIMLVNKTPFSGFLNGGVASLVDTYPKVKEYIESIATHEAMEAMDYARENCMVSLLLKYPFQDLFSTYYTSRGKQLLDNKDLREVLDELTMGLNKEQTPDVPVLMIHGKVDEIAPYRSGRKTAENWCKHGGQIQFHTYDTDLSAHFISQITGTTMSFNWLRDRLEGKPVKDGCQFTSSKDVLLDVDELGDEFKYILEMLDGFAGDKIGPGDNIITSRIRKQQAHRHHVQRSSSLV